MVNEDINKPWDQLTPNDILKIHLLEGYNGLIKRGPVSMWPRFAFEKALKYVPANPRCKWCSAPFTGLGAPFMRAIGKDKSKYNPNFCTECEDFVRKYNAGTEVDLSLLFADIRGSTTLAEEMSAPEFSSLINRFYTVTSKILVQAMAYIDKLAGDQVSAFFSPGMAGPHHYEIALDSARAILEATGHSDPGGPWVPVGIGVHGGQTYFGAVGSAQQLTDLTILGDPPNTAARLASTAKAGEILVSQVAAEKAELDTAGLEKRSLELKGKTETVDVWVLAAHTK